MSSLILPRDATQRDSVPWIDRGGVENSTMVLAAVHAMTHADPVWLTLGYKADAAAQTSTRIFNHIAPPAPHLMPA